MICKRNKWLMVSIIFLSLITGCGFPQELTKPLKTISPNLGKTVSYLTSKSSFWKYSGSVSRGSWFVVTMPKQSIKEGEKYEVVVTPRSGDPDLYVFGYSPYRRFTYSLNWNLTPEVSSFQRSDLFASETSARFGIYGYNTSSFLIEIFVIKQTPDTLELPDGPVGTVYIPLPSYGEVVTSYLTVDAKANKSDTTGTYQCVELIKRFNKEVFGIPIFSTGNGRYVAKSFDRKMGNYQGRKMEYIFYQSGSATKPPKNGTIISFSSPASTGHVAIVKKASCNTTSCDLWLFEQNWIFTSNEVDKMSHSRKISCSQSNSTWSCDKAIGWSIPTYQ